MGKDPFRGGPHVIVLADAWNAWDNKPAIGNSRAACAELMEKYKDLDSWFGIEQEYTLMKPGKVGEPPKVPGQWEYQVGPCRGIEMGDHLTMARYIMLRVTEKHNVVCSFSPKPMEGDWNGAGCHTNFSIAPMRQD